MLELSPSLITALNGTVAAFAAIVAVGVAAQQKRIAHAKLQADLFDRRFTVYQTTRSVLFEAIRKRDWPDTSDAEFVKQIETARFLFPSEVAAKLVDIRTRLLDLWCASEDIKEIDFGDQERPKILEERKKTVARLRDDYLSLLKLFAPHMRVSG